jgi:hypothetical protein
LIWAITEAAVSNQEGKKSNNESNPDDVIRTVCVKKMDACYDDCKPGEVQPGVCNLNCTTDKICGMPLRMSYGEFLDFQVEMLAANRDDPPQNAKSLPAQPQALPGHKRRPHHNRVPGAPAKPPADRPAAVSAGTGAPSNNGLPRLNLPQLSWPRF